MTQLKRIFHTTALAAFAAMLAGLLSGEARAEPASSWTLEGQSGQVNLVKTGIAPVSLTTGDVFADGDWIETGPDGRAMLRRGEETIVVAPNSRIGLPKNNDGPYATRILQTLGTILLTVEKQAAQHFEIETPYLTAVVKGTTFTVGIQDGRAVVHVVEGLVEVKNLSSGRRNLVRPGQTGSVIRGGGGVEIGGGSNDVKGTPAKAEAKQAPGKNQKAEQAAPASQASPVAVMAVSKSKSRKVMILQALGPTTLDLSQSTKGLVRAATAPGKGYTAGKKADAASKAKPKSHSRKLVRSAGSASGPNASAAKGLNASAANGLQIGGRGVKPVRIAKPVKFARAAPIQTVKANSGRGNGKSKGKGKNK